MPRLACPAEKRPTAEKGGLAISLHPLSLVRESYQTLCTALLFSLPEAPPQTILITSSQPQEGKTVTAMNIAMTLTRNGGSVLLIDADLRNGRCHKILGAQNEEEIRGKTIHDFFPSEFADRYSNDDMEVMAEGKAV